MHRGSVLGFLIGLVSGEKENTPTNNIITTAAGNMIAKDLHDMTSLPSIETETSLQYTIMNSVGGIAPGTIVAAPSSKSLTRDLVGECVGVEHDDHERVVILIDGIHHSYHESLIIAL